MDDFLVILIMLVSRPMLIRIFWSSMIIPVSQLQSVCLITGIRVWRPPKVVAAPSAHADHQRPKIPVVVGSSQPHGIAILGIYESHASIISFVDLTRGSLAIASVGKHHGFIWWMLRWSEKKKKNLPAAEAASLGTAVAPRRQHAVVQWADVIPMGPVLLLNHSYRMS